jgi:hypothetical protein
MAGSVVAVAFLAGSAASSFVSPLPPLLARARCGPSGGHDHPDQRRRVRCRWLPWRGSSATRRGKKQEDPQDCCCLFCVAPPTVDARTSTPRRTRLLLRRLRLPRRPVAIMYMECTPVSTLAATLAPSRRYVCGGISTGGSYLWLLLQSHCLRCFRLRLRGDVRVCVSICVGGLAPLLGCRPIRVRVPWVSIYVTIFYAIHNKQSILS